MNTCLVTHSPLQIQRDVCVTIADHGRCCLRWIFIAHLGMTYPNLSQRSNILSQKKAKCEAGTDKNTENPGQKKEETRGFVLKLDLPVYDLVSHHFPVFTTKTGCLNPLIHHFHPFSDHVSSTWEFSSWFGLLGLLGFADGGRTVQLTAYRLQRSRSARAERRHGPQHPLGQFWCLTHLDAGGPQHAAWAAARAGSVLLRFCPTPDNCCQLQFKNISYLYFFSTSFGPPVSLNHHHHHRRNISGQTWI